MSLDFSIEAGILKIVAVGDPSREEQGALALRWSRHPDYEPGMPILLDNRARTAISTRAHIAEMAEATARSSLPEGTRCAVVVPSTVEFGMTRMFEALSEEGPLRVRAFRDVEEAEAWLLA